MISKELLSEVLASPTKVDYYGLSLFGYGNKNLLFKWKSSIDGTEVEDSINIYELAHKCKELVFNNYSIMLESAVMCNASGCRIIDKMGICVMVTDAKTEPEAIFKACQYILDNKGTN